MSDTSSFYVPLDSSSAINDHGQIVQEGETCHIDALKNRFAWMRGHVNAYYGWANDGKGTMIDYLSVMKAKFSGWKTCFYKREDMDVVLEMVKGRNRGKIKANRILYNLAWTLTGKTWSEGFRVRNKGAQLMTLDEKMDALDFISNHFYPGWPKDRKFKTLQEGFRAMHEMYGIDHFIYDPWAGIELEQNERGDERLIRAFDDVKQFHLETNSVGSLVGHAKAQTDARVSKDRNSAFKVVDQFMILGGSAWDMKMDGQFSIYRCERHLDSADKKVHFWNLKQRDAETVGVDRGVTKGIEFDRLKRQYYFDGVNPLTGELKSGSAAQAPEIAFPTSKPIHDKKEKFKDDDRPF